MEKKGLLVVPNFEEKEKYLQSGKMTEITEYIRKVADSIEGETDGIILRKIILWIHKNTKRLCSPKDERKFKRTASEILLSKERTGCCDTATLFTAIARCKGIPTMQIITFSKAWGEEFERGIAKETKGHYFTASYIKDQKDKSDWVLLDPDRYALDIRDVRMIHLKTENRNIGNDYYAFAYVNDYRDVKVEDIIIDSISSMGRIQEKAYRECNKKDFTRREDYER